MKSRRSRIAIGLAVGAVAASISAAAATVSLSSGSSSAVSLSSGSSSANSENPYRIAGGGFTSKEACEADWEDFIKYNPGAASEHKCLFNGGYWDMYIR